MKLLRNCIICHNVITQGSQLSVKIGSIPPTLNRETGSDISKLLRGRSKIWKNMNYVNSILPMNSDNVDVQKVTQSVLHVEITGTCQATRWRGSKKKFTRKKKQLKIKILEL